MRPFVVQHLIPVDEHTYPWTRRTVPLVLSGFRSQLPEQHGVHRRFLQAKVQV